MCGCFWNSAGLSVGVAREGRLDDAVGGFGVELAFSLGALLGLQGLFVGIFGLGGF